MRTPVIIILLNFLFVINLFSQNTFYEREKELKVLGDSILRGTSDSVRSGSCTLFNLKFEALLQDSSSFHQPFDSLKNVSILTSHDKTLRVYSWILPSVAGNKFNFYGFIQMHDKKTKKESLFKLEEDSLPAEDVDRKFLNSKNWFGVLYYKLIENKTKSGKIYTLLGWRGKNRQTTMKVIDVLTVEKGIPKFGVPIFKTEKGIKHRVIFEYTSRAVMSLRYNEKKKMIVMDHLSPPSPNHKGQYEFYGPDLSYDAFKFKKDQWVFMKNIVVGNPVEYDVKTKKQEIKPKEFFTPGK